VVGRANWTFCDSDDGAEWNAIATSLIASSQLHGIERWAYLRDVLTLLPAWPSSAVLQLAPKFWQQTRQELQTQQRLSAARLLGRSTRPMRRSLWLQASRCTNAVHRTRTITSSGIACFVARSHEFNTMDRTRASVVLLELVAGIALTVA
jgi:hypothetical protein